MFHGGTDLSPTTPTNVEPPDTATPFPFVEVHGRLAWRRLEVTIVSGSKRDETKRCELARVWRRCNNNSSTGFPNAFARAHVVHVDTRGPSV